MAYKSVFTTLTSIRDSAPEFDFALAMAEAQDAHLDVLCLGVDRSPQAYFEIGANAVVMHAAIEEAHTLAGEISTVARTKLDPTGLRWDVFTGIATASGTGRTVAAQACFADLAVTGMPYGVGTSAVDVMVLEGLLFETDCPVIVVPDGPFSVRPETIVVAWNQSAEAMRAVRAAMPLLRAAKAVHIAIIDPPESGPERSDPGGALAVYLSRHDIRSDIHVMTRQGLSISERLAHHVVESGAELLVMGGYGHSRFREAVLGGATRDVLEHSKVPVLMAH